jgi:2-polyprenyl-3-methyl-5-hydroxy-6-metoxy-1,4-benzoquinol methylase
MSKATDHYENLLAEHYSWMFDVSPAVKATQQRELLTLLNITPGELAVDLGAGSGFQSMALADMGFKRVLAIDTSSKLLEELRCNCAGHPVEAIQSDMLQLSQHVTPGAADVVVCMGDTLPHLPAHELVPRLFASVFRALRPTGQLVLTIRDLSSELHGDDRFILVRSAADKIMTCFLEYGVDTVMVHDLIHVRDGDSWKLLKSSYPKLRLHIDEVCRSLEDAGFEVYAMGAVPGMHVLAARRG